jgi:hypothetical protein
MAREAMVFVDPSARMTCASAGKHELLFLGPDDVASGLGSDEESVPPLVDSADGCGPPDEVGEEAPPTLEGALVEVFPEFDGEGPGDMSGEDPGDMSGEDPSLELEGASVDEGLESVNCLTDSLIGVAKQAIVRQRVAARNSAKRAMADTGAQTMMGGISEQAGAADRLNVNEKLKRMAQGMVVAGNDLTC